LGFGLSALDFRLLLQRHCRVEFEGNTIGSVEPNARFYMTDKTIVLSTCGSLEEAQSIARTLVERQLAACVNIIPQVQSIYRWQGEVESATECLLVIKSTAGAFERLRDALRELHSYGVPECIELTISNGNASYLDWIGESVR
jgi:periplasmic divalent cation tolerance protein